MSEPNAHDTLTNSQFEHLFKLHFVPLCKYAHQYVPDVDTAQDICQKVFIALWEKREQIDPKKSIKSYLFTAVRNRCLNYIRDNKKYRSQVLDLDCGDFDIVNTEEEDYDLEALQARIKTALETLPEKCRLVFEMSRFQNMKYREIVEELNIAQKTVEAHMSKAMKLLRIQLKDYTLGLILLFFL